MGIRDRSRPRGPRHRWAQASLAVGILSLVALAVAAFPAAVKSATVDHVTVDETSIDEVTTEYRGFKVEQRIQGTFTFVSNSPKDTRFSELSAGRRPIRATGPPRFRPARDKAGLPGFRWHDLRHFAVLALIEQRADISSQAVAGHSSATMTLDVSTGT